MQLVFPVRRKAATKCIGQAIAGLCIMSLLGVCRWPNVAGQESPATKSTGGGGANDTLPAPLSAAAAPNGKRIADSAAAKEFHEKIEPILTAYCYECHGFGEKKGGIQFDTVRDEALTGDAQRWSKTLKNVRAHVMPPAGSDRPTDAEIQTLTNWIKYRAFGIDPADIDPGPVTIHRLNRSEYRNTIFDLLGVDFNAADELPPDASGLGFDNIAELLSVSPLMLEKYLNAADSVLDGAFPSESSPDVVVDENALRGNGNPNGRRLRFSGSPALTYTYRNDNPGNYRVVLQLEVVAEKPPRDAMPPEAAKDAAKPDEKPSEAKADAAKSEAPKPDNATPDLAIQHAEGAASADNAKPNVGKAEKPTPDAPAAEPAPQPGRLVVSLQSGVSDRVTLLRKEFPPESQQYEFTFDQTWTTEPHKFDFEIIAPPRPEGARRGNFRGLFAGRNAPAGPDFVVKKLVLQPQKSAPVKRFFPLDTPPTNAEQLHDYLRKGITEFTRLAFRRPADAKTIDLLVAEVEKSYAESSHFNESLKLALAKVLCSPRFLFRIDRAAAEPKDHRTWAPIDEYSLASRLSYFLWSSMPDDELLSLAAVGELHANLHAQVERMLASEKSRSFIENFSGQWLQTRNVLNWSIVEKAVLEREGISSNKPVLTPAVRQGMVDETTMFFGRIVHENRSVLEFIDSDYTYLNEELAKHYQISGVSGPAMRLVTLSKDNHRGGILTQGSMLLVTSNSNRTSPVKRGVFVLDKFLGLRPHDPPPNVPGLEDASAGIKDHEPTFREMLELHRADALCASCHQLMDPIGLALENFNAMGAYREQEFKQPIDASGTLITGEKFSGVDDLKQILLTSQRTNFYRCLTEKLLTYVLGREIGYYDAESVDQIVGRLETDDGKFSALLLGIVDSAPFQKRRLVVNPLPMDGKSADNPPGSP